MKTLRMKFGTEYEEQLAGYAGENRAVRLVFGCANVLDAYPGAMFSVSITRYGETPYIADAGMAADAETGEIVYDVTSTDVAIPGPLEIEVAAVDAGGARLLSTVYPFVVRAGAWEITPFPPEATWVQNVQGWAADAHASQLAAEAAEESAEGSAATAVEAAGAAGQSEQAASENAEASGASAAAAAGSAGAAQAAQGAAAGSAAVAEQAAGVATGAAGAAVQAQGAAAGSAAAAANSEQSALGHKNDAEAAKNTAEQLVGEFADDEAERVRNEAQRVENEGGRVQAEAARGLAEDARAASEQERVTGEAGRDAAEQNRVTAETGRVTAENERAAAENVRMTNEGGRATAEATRDTDEGARVANEDARVTAETGRATAEEERDEAEGVRTTQETGRVDAEGARVTAEGKRVTAETGRATAEGQRATNETARVGAETVRQTQEGERQADTAEAVARANAAVDDLEATALRVAASCWRSVQVGQVVVVAPAGGSVMLVTASADCTVTHGEETHSLLAGVATEITATEGVNTLAASAGRLEVWYNRATVDVANKELFPTISATGNPATLDGCVADQPMDVKVKIVTPQEGVPSPDTPIPIEGVERVTVTRCGKNLLDKTKIGYTHNSTYEAIDTGGRVTAPTSTTNAMAYIAVDHRPLVGRRATFRFDCDTWAANKQVRFAWIGTAWTNNVAWASSAMQPGVDTAITISEPPTTLPGLRGLFLLLYHTSGTSVAAGTYTDFLNIQFEVGAVVSPYEPYRGEPFEVALPETVYGLPGAADLVDLATGEITRRVRPVVFDGTETWDGATIGTNTVRFYTTLSAAYPAPNLCPGLASHMPWTTDTTNSDAVLAAITLTGGTINRLYIRLPKSMLPDTADTATLNAACKQWVADQHTVGTPLEIVHLLTTPIVSAGAISPVTIPALSGRNTLFMDAGGTLEVGAKQSLPYAIKQIQNQITTLQGQATGG